MIAWASFYENIWINREIHTFKISSNIHSLNHTFLIYQLAFGIPSALIVQNMYIRIQPSTPLNLILYHIPRLCFTVLIQCCMGMWTNAYTMHVYTLFLYIVLIYTVLLCIMCHCSSYFEYCMSIEYVYICFDVHPNYITAKCVHFSLKTLSITFSTPGTMAIC